MVTIERLASDRPVIRRHASGLVTVTPLAGRFDVAGVDAAVIDSKVSGDIPDPGTPIGAALSAAIEGFTGERVDTSMDDAAFDAFLAGLDDGAVIFIPPNETLELADEHTLTQPVSINGPGRILDTRTSPDSALFTIGPAASGTEIRCHLEGSVGGEYHADHHAIKVQGTDNGAGNPPTFVTDLVLKPASIGGFGSVGIFTEFLKDYVVEIDVIHDMGYGGVMHSSMLNGTDTIHQIRDLTPGTSSNVYGLHYSRRDQTDDLVRYPHSEGFDGYVGEMHGLGLWDGLGTHGGQNGNLGWGSMFDVRKAFDVVAATGSDGEPEYAPHNITIDQGSADSGVTDGSYGPAGTVTGAYKSTDSLGSPTEYATGIVIKPGATKGYGQEDDAAGGAYLFHSTQGLVAALGAAVEPSPYAVNLYHDNKDFAVSVQALDPWSTALGAAGVVNVSSTHNTGVVDFSGGSRGAKSATIVYNRGIAVSNDATNVVRIGAACNFVGATVPVSGPVYARVAAPLLHPVGSAAAPSVTFDGDTDTGFYSAAADQLAIAVGGTLRARWLTTALLLSDGYNFSLGTGTGTMFGTGATHKLGFWGKTPVVQPSANADTSGATLTDLEIEVNQLKALLRSVGLMAT